VAKDPPALVDPPVAEDPPKAEEALEFEVPPAPEEPPVAGLPPEPWLLLLALQFAAAAAKAKHPIHAVIVG
jgi:hypothetical protein